MGEGRRLENDHFRSNKPTPPNSDEMSPVQIVQAIVPLPEDVWFLGRIDRYNPNAHVRFHRKAGRFTVETNLLPEIAIRLKNPEQGDYMLFNTDNPARLLVTMGFEFRLSDEGKYVLFDPEGRAQDLPPIATKEIDRWYRDICYGVVWSDNLLKKKEELLELLRTGQMTNQAGSFVARGDSVWVGLDGGFSEGLGTLGGLAVYDLSTKRWRLIRHALLIEHAVSSVMFVEQEIWLGTLHAGEYASSSQSGLVLYNPDTGHWHNLNKQNSRNRGEPRLLNG